MRVNYLGMVVGNAMQKTIKVRVARHEVHPIACKVITRTTDYLVHDENELTNLGDIVRIEECRKLSKKKTFAVAEIVKSVDKYTGKGDGIPPTAGGKTAPGLEAEILEQYKEMGTRKKKGRKH